MSRDPGYLAEIRPAWRENRLESIAEFADLDLQRRSWLSEIDYGGPYWSYVEWMCRCFDDCSFSAGHADFIADGLMSQAEADAVRQFHAAAEVYKAPGGNDLDHAAILSDPAWLNVVSLADNARRQLLAILDDPSERSLLERK